MADQMENTFVKRHNEHDDNEPPAKHQKLDSNTATKITDLNGKCLENIMSRLDLSSLLSVAMSNKKLQTAAASTFGSKFGTKTICLQNVINCCTPRIYTLDDDICVRGLEFCLPFLRIFGSTIADLNVFDGTYPHVLVSKEYQSKFSHHMDRYLNQYCADNVSSLVFYGRPAFSLDNFRKPFRMVRQMRLIDTDVETGLSNFGKWFPSLCHLEMNLVSIDGAMTAVPTLPLLEHLTLKINNHAGDDNWEWNFTVQNAIELLRSNRQLRSLDIDMPKRETITIHRLLDIINHNPSISKLAMSDGHQYEYEHVNVDELSRFVSERPLLEEIDLPRHRFTLDNVCFCIRHLKLLKKFRFQMTYLAEYDQLTQTLSGNWQVEEQSNQIVQLVLTTQQN